MTPEQFASALAALIVQAQLFGIERGLIQAELETALEILARD